MYPSVSCSCVFLFKSIKKHKQPFDFLQNLVVIFMLES